MKFEEGWLLRQLEQASAEVAAWPEWKRKAYQIVQAVSLSDEEYLMRWEDARKYGNY